jgi:hypothetical protein
MLTLFGKFASRFMKELIFAFVVGLIADIGIDAVRDWAKNRPKEHVAEKPAERTEIASKVVPPLPTITIEEEKKSPPSQIAQTLPPPTASVEPLGGGPITNREGQTFADSYKFRCTDGKGIQGEFRAAIFLHQYNWEFGADGVQLAGTRQSFDSILREEGLREALGDARELIAIGTASCEGGKEGEEIRAGNRALKVRGIINPPDSAPTINSYYINLGQFRPQKAEVLALCDGKSTAKTRSQRKIILVAVDRKNEDLDLQWCLGQILAKCPDLNHYSNFDNFKLAW